MDFSPALGTLEALGRSFVAALPAIGIALVVFAAFWAAGRAVRALVERSTLRRRRHRNLALVLGRVTQGAVVVLGTLVAAVVVFPNFSPGQLVELLGIGSVAAGLAFRDVLQNFLAGILILLTEPFRIDDQIVAGDVEGTVVDIQTRATIIRTYDGRNIVIPNARLFTDRVTVNTAYESRRIEYDVGIGLSDDIDEAKHAILGAVRAVDGVLADPAPDVLVWELAESSVKLRVRWWVAPPRRSDALESRDAVLSAVKRALLGAGVDLPFPTYQVLFHDQTEETDGDRARQREGWPARRGETSPRPRSSTVDGRKPSGRPS